MLIKCRKKIVFPIYRGKHIKLKLTPSPFVPPTGLPHKWGEAINYTWNNLAANKWNELEQE